MKKLRVIIDGNSVYGGEGMTILETAKKNGIDIPTLCYSEDFAASGNCRICVVEVDGFRSLIGSCHTPIADGMVIHTRSPKVDKARKATVELLMAAHTGQCVSDSHTGECELRKLADRLQVGEPRFKMRKPRWYPREDSNPYVTRDMSKCILCRKCVDACRELAKNNIYSIAQRGFSSKIIVDCDVPLTSELCRGCDICIEYCPTGALSKPMIVGEMT
jgi:NADH dehydrogenase/NADH:ubiquinone oxidoreductase subunit G